MGDGWSHRRACGLLGVRESRAWRWRTRRADDRLGDGGPGGHAVHGLLDEEKAQIVAVFEEWGEIDRSHRKLAHRGSLTLAPAARRSAVWALASAVPHPDIFGSIDGSPDPAACAVLEASLQWSVEEIVGMLELVPDGFERGMFGQHVYQLMVMDDDHQLKIIRAAIQAAQQGASEAASWALVLAVYWAGDDGGSQFAKLLAIEPALRDTWAAEQIGDVFQTFDNLTLF
jgi:hypothetical protein